MSGIGGRLERLEEQFVEKRKAEALMRFASLFQITETEIQEWLQRRLEPAGPDIAVKIIWEDGTKEALNDGN